MAIYAKLINGVPTGHHRQFDSQPAVNGNETWLPVVYGNRVQQVDFDPVYQTVVPTRTVIDNTVVYEEIITALPIESVRANKLKALQAEYDQLLESGYFDSVSGRTLAWQSTDRNAFLSYFTKQEYKLRSGLIQPTDPAVISDINQSPIFGLTVEQVLSILTSYGDAYEVLWQRIAVANGNVQAANTVEAILSINL